MDTENLTIKSASEALRNKDFSAVELTESYLKNIEANDKDVRAYLEVFDDAITSAKEADVSFSKGEYSPLLGIPLAIKDNILIKGHIASAASKMLENYKATYDATVISRLRKEGAVFLGRVNMDEFAMGGSTENSAFGVTKNPHDLSRVSGGSSGGSAAAVAASLALGALGSDTGGSVRQPASYCGVVGFKPTYGTVSRNGLIALGSSLDQIGPLTKTVEDSEIIFDAIKGADKMDSTSLRDPVYSPNGGKVVGVPRGFLRNGVDNEVMENFERTLRSLESSGYTIKEIELPNIKASLAVYYIIMPAEASTNLSRFDGMRYGLHVNGASLIDDYKESRGAGFGEEVRRRILLGTYVLSSGYYDAYYGKATAVRKIITNDFLEAFKRVDLIATPTTPSTAFVIGEKADPLSMYLEDIFTVSSNLTGMPSISIPMGTVPNGGRDLPIGFQFIAPHLHEKSLFEGGKDVEASI
ncbi:MAG: Asp-tRNA(Asn)/Glu-tRNA(Gln) amidotransferase subunit GatA [Parcubacteria group bacterium]|nr:Asp-tRNA(Asn)/Glu-tRNA(Gln) amidotransferase subunit GatA [Parcubacteria group bacterium]